MQLTELFYAHKLKIIPRHSTPNEIQLEKQTTHTHTQTTEK